jgi:hypothetical protein
LKAETARFPEPFRLPEAEEALDSFAFTAVAAAELDRMNFREVEANRLKR